MNPNNQIWLNPSILLIFNLIPEWCSNLKFINTHPRQTRANYFSCLHCLQSTTQTHTQLLLWKRHWWLRNVCITHLVCIIYKVVISWNYRVQYINWSRKFKLRTLRLFTILSMYKFLRICCIRESIVWMNSVPRKLIRKKPISSSKICR